MGPVKVQPPFINPMIEILVAAKVFQRLLFIIIHHFDESLFNLIEIETQILIVNVTIT